MDEVNKTKANNVKIKRCFMKILPITISNIQNITSSDKLKPKLLEISVDTIAFSGKNLSYFKKISSKTAEKLYNNSHVVTGKCLDKYPLSTFVFDAKKGKPVDLFVISCPLSSNNIAGYALYLPETKYCAKQVGVCYFQVNPNKSIIKPYFFYSDDKNLKGVGCRLQQLVFECTLAENCDKIKLLPEKSAVDFYKKLGYEFPSGRKYMELSKDAFEDWMKIVKKQPILNLNSAERLQ